MSQEHKQKSCTISVRILYYIVIACTPAGIAMGTRIHTQLDLLHPNLFARMTEKTGNAELSTSCVYNIGEPVMVKDY